MSDADFERGALAGELKAMKEILTGHKERLDGHSKRLRMLERLAWMLMGIVALANALPIMKAFVAAIK